jgi:hypothetical protein
VTLPEHTLAYVFWRMGMAVAAICVGGLLLALWLVLMTVWHLRPEAFNFKARVTRWISLDVEMRSPEKPREPWSPGRESSLSDQLSDDRPGQ